MKENFNLISLNPPSDSQLVSLTSCPPDSQTRIVSFNGLRLQFDRGTFT